MILKEYIPVTQDGKEVIPSTPKTKLIVDFVKQLETRGCDSCCVFKEKNNNMGAFWSEKFSSNDMLNLVTHFANKTMSPKQRMLFGIQIQNTIAGDALTDFNL